MATLDHDSQNTDEKISTLKKLALSLGIALAVVLFVFGIGTLLGIAAFAKTWDALQDLWPWNSTTTVQVVPPNIDNIRYMGQLETLEQELSTMVTAKRDYTLVDDEELIYGVCGRIVAGVDLSNLTAEDAQVEGNTITLRLPPAEVFSVNITTKWRVSETDVYNVEGDIKAQIVPPCDHIYKWSQSTGRDKTPELVQDAQEQAQLLFEEIANDPDFLARAQKNAEDTLKRLLKAAGYEEVVFLYGQPNAAETASTPPESAPTEPSATP